MIFILSVSVNIKHFFLWMNCRPLLYLGHCSVDILQAFSDSQKLLETSVPSDMQQRAKGLVVFHVSKAYSPASAYGNCCGIISKGV